LRNLLEVKIFNDFKTETLALTQLIENHSSQIVQINSYRSVLVVRPAVTQVVGNLNEDIAELIRIAVRLFDNSLKVQPFILILVDEFGLLHWSRKSTENYPMNAIEITTTQNVVIQVRVASLLERMIEFIIDFIVLCLFALLLANILEFFNVPEWFYYIYALFIMTFSLWNEILFRGQSAGKAILGIKVIKMNGGQPDFIDYFRRWSVRWLDVWASLGSVGILSMATSPFRQRVGDKMADTIVIKKKQQSGYSLKDILSIANSTSYEAKYPEIQQAVESHMLTVKRLLNRSSKYPSIDTYKKLIIETARKFETELGIQRKEKSSEAFLKQLLKDYVILTR